MLDVELHSRKNYFQESIIPVTFTAYNATVTPLSDGNMYGLSVI